MSPSPRSRSPKALPLTGDADADALLASDPLALLIGMLLDQQVPLERAFRAPAELKARLGGKLEAADVAARDPEELVAVFSATPALHRYPGSMAGRVQQLCQVVVDELDGDPANAWQSAEDGKTLVANLSALPGFGKQKARIFAALLGKQLGVQPPGWRDACAPYGEEGTYRSVADIDSPDALDKVRETKRRMKAEAKAASRS